MQTAAASSKPQAVKPDNTPTPKLYWNEQGAVCCGVHAPYQGSDTWVNERWMALSPGEYRAACAAYGEHPVCEVGKGCDFKTCSERPEHILDEERPGGYCVGYCPACTARSAQDRREQNEARS